MLPSNGQPQTVTPRPIRLFLVEDQALFSSLLREILSAHPQFEVMGVAATAQGALEGLENLAVDLVLVDLMLPDMSGLELIDRLMARRPTYKIIVCSAASHDLAIAMAFGLGVHGFVEKTCGIPELIEALEGTALGSFCLSPHVSEVLRRHARADAGATKIRPGDLGILRRLLQHESVAAIARDLGLSASGVYKVRQRIARRSGARSQRELYQVAVELGLLAGRPDDPGARRSNVPDRKESA